MDATSVSGYFAVAPTASHCTVGVARLPFEAILFDQLTSVSKPSYLYTGWYETFTSTPLYIYTTSRLVRVRGPTTSMSGFG